MEVDGATLWIAVAILSLGNIPQPLWASDYQVTNINSSGPGSFQAALISANGDPGSTITFQNGLGTINVGTLPDLTGSFTINGGVGNTLSGQNAGRILFVNAPGQTIQINNLTLANGLAQGGNGATGGGGGGGGAGLGGAVFVNAGNVIFNSVAFANNAAKGGNGANSGIGGGGGGGGLGTLPEARLGQRRCKSARSRRAAVARKHRLAVLRLERPPELAAACMEEFLGVRPLMATAAMQQVLMAAGAEGSMIPSITAKDSTAA